MNSMNKKLLFVVASNNYQPIEFETPKELLEQEGFVIDVASDASGIAHAEDGSTTPVNYEITQVDLDNYDGIVFIGGSGTMQHLDNDKSYSLIQSAVMDEKLVAGICHATRILAKAGALVTKNATGWDGDGKLDDIYKKHAVIYNEAPVITDGKIITAIGPDEADEFAQAIMAVV